ncbi:MAG: hypothetical protein ACK5IQ_08545, partial [Bacteroidales bacterium]
PSEIKINKQGNFSREYLAYGQLYANFDKNNQEEKKWVDMVFKWVKDNGKKVYRTTLDMRIVSDFHEQKSYCLPDASEKYNGSNGNFLTIVHGVVGIAK